MSKLELVCVVYFAKFNFELKRTQIKANMRTVLPLSMSQYNKTGFQINVLTPRKMNENKVWLLTIMWVIAPWRSHFYWNTSCCPNWRERRKINWLQKWSINKHKSNGIVLIISLQKCELICDWCVIYFAQKLISSESGIAEKKFLSKCHSFHSILIDD